MTAARHPSELNPWQVYRQAKMLLKHTSRASNPDWYREALELDRQWHIWVDGGQPASAVFDRRSGAWHQGPAPVLPRHGGPNDPPFDDSSLRALHEALAQVIRGEQFGGKAASLGVALHLADEFAVSDLAPDFSIDENFTDVRDLLAEDPALALGDASLDALAHSWRLLPYWAIEEGERRSVAIQVTRRYQPLVDELRRYASTRNIPVIPGVHAAPLEALRMAPWFLEEGDGMGQGNLFVFHYRRFSALAVLDAAGELVMMRALPHRSGTEHPQGLGDILVNTAASVGLAEPLVTIVAMSEVNQEPLATELSAFFASRPPMNIGLVAPGKLEGLAAIPGGKVEMALGDADLVRRLSEASPLRDTETARQLGQGWAAQNFYGASAEEAEKFPSRGDLRLLRFSGLGKLALVAAVAGAGTLTGLEYFRSAGTEAWKLPPMEAKEAELRLAKLKADRQRVDYWENVMARRSEGWLVMEVLLQLFEPDSGLIVTESSYVAEGRAEGKAEGKGPGKGLGNKPKALGFERRWTVKGHARDDGASHLGRLSSNTFLKERFERLAAEYEAESLRLDTDTRDLDVSVQQRQGQMQPTARYPAAVARHYRNAFEISIVQRFTEKDVLALTMKPPGKDENDSATP